MSSATSLSDDILRVEDVIQRKLLFEGNGNDDSRLTKLTKTFTSWCYSNNSDQNQTKADFTHLLRRLDRVRCDAKKSTLVIQTLEDIKGEYIMLKGQIKKEIAVVNSFVKTQIDMNQQFMTKKNQMSEYNNLLSIVLTLPDRKAVLFKVDKLRQEVDELKVKLEDIQTTLTLRKKQLLVLLRLSQDLAERFDSEDNPGGRSVNFGPSLKQVSEVDTLTFHAGDAVEDSIPMDLVFDSKMTEPVMGPSETICLDALITQVLGDVK